MVKQILILIIFLVICFWGKAANNDIDDFHGDIQSPAVRNSLKFNYDQIAATNIKEQTNFSDDFNLPKLRSLWHSNVNEFDWTLNERPGFLRIKAQKISNIDEYLTENTISQNVIHNTSGEAISFIDLTNLTEDSKAGLYYSSKRINYISVVTKNGEKRLEVKVNNKVVHGPDFSENTIILRVKIDNSKVWFEYSFDGLIYVKLGAEFKVNVLLNEYDSIGLFCLNDDYGNSSIDIDWFYYKTLEDITRFAENVNKILYPEL